MIPERKRAVRLALETAREGITNSYQTTTPAHAVEVPENMARFRVGLFGNDLGLLLGSLTGDEFKTMFRFRLEHLLVGAAGIPDDDAELIHRTGCKGWPRLKAKLLALGILRTEGGMLRDDDLERSVRKQRAAREHGRKGAVVRWNARRIGGDA